MEPYTTFESVFDANLMKIAVTHKNIRMSFSRCVKKITLLAAIGCGVNFNMFPQPAGGSQEIEVDTAVFLRQAKELQELLVSPTKDKYSKRNNPAVDLIRNVRACHKKGDPRSGDYYSYDQYDKITLGLLDITADQLQKFEFLTDYLDTTQYGDRSVLNVMLKEKASTKLYSNSGKDSKTLVKAKNSTGIAEVMDTGNLGDVIEDFLHEVDIYDNDITLMANKFPSPLSQIGPDYYKYYIADTLDIDGTKCVQLTFTPRNPESFSFSGNLYIALGDTTGFVKKVSMKVPRTVNLNYVDNLYIDQTYDKDEHGLHHKTHDEINLDISVMKGTQPFYARRVTNYSNFQKKFRKDLKHFYNMLGDIIEINESPDKSEAEWESLRGESLSSAEGNMDTFMTRLREIPFFYWAEKALVILVSGYIKTGKESKFDFGPINTLISTNPIEGARLRIGGITTANLSPHWFARGYVAYGTKDKKWKYKGELEYSFNKKKYHSREFPVNSLRASYMYDLDMIGQHYLFTNSDNVFLSIKRRKSRLATYRKLGKLEYNLELANNLSFSMWAEHARQKPSPWLPFINGAGISSGGYGRTSLGISVRYAPGEKFLQEKSNRLTVNREAPIFLISQEWGPRALPGADFATCKTELSVSKRFWFSSFGYLDAILKGGLIWSKVPYPELLWPNANLSYTIQPESYSLMNPMEFAIDRFASCDLTYWGNGVLFNRIPLVKKARLREVVGFKGLLGSLSRRNNPMLHESMYQFPEDCHVSLMDGTPYMEVSAGIDNIFTVLRIDYVWRLSYLHHPGIDRSGLRVALHFNF